MAASVPAIAIERVTKAYGTVQAVADVSVGVDAGSFFALLGPSGCGKTTLMRLIAGFEAPDAGIIRIDGEDMAGVPPERRPVNMMFQSYALFPHMTVAGNIGYGLRRAGLSRREVEAGVEAMLALVQLDGLASRKPDQLSGGQRQRVALARALARKPRILLLDEPMAALDRKLREETQFALKDIQRQLGTTFLVVTHDQDEAMSLADQVALMRSGRIEQIGTPAALYAQPVSRFAAGFVGETNLLSGTVRFIDEGGIVAETPDGPIAAHTRRPVEVGGDVTLAIRPENLVLAASSDAQAGKGHRFTGRVHDVSFRGAATVLRLELASGATLRVAVPGAPAAGFAVGATASVQVAPEHVWILGD